MSVAINHVKFAPTVSGGSVITAEQHASRFTLELSTDNDAVSFRVVAVINDGTSTTSKTVVMPEPRTVSSEVCEGIVRMVDNWFDFCEWGDVPLSLVRELLRIRKAFHGVYIESL